MDEKNKVNLKGIIRKCLKETYLYAFFRNGKIIFPLFPISLTDEIYGLITKKYQKIADIYGQKEIYEMILSKTRMHLNSNAFSNLFEGHVIEKGLSEIGKMKDLVEESKFAEITDNITYDIIREIVEPGYSYSLIQLPNVELYENIGISDDLILASDTKCADVLGHEDFFRIAKNIGENISFSLENKKTYLLIKQCGRNWFFVDDEEPLVYKNLKRQLKIFIGLSLIKGIFIITNIARTERKAKIDLPIGIFLAGEWFEGIPQEEEDPIYEDHPEFDEIRDIFANGDDLRHFCFQKRFFLNDEIKLPETTVKLIDSLAISDRISKPIIDRNEGKIIKLPLPNIENTSTPEAKLRTEFGKLETIFDSNEVYAERIKASSLWYLEGCCADNDTVEFINYTIAIEALLGGANKKDLPLTEVLSNKCGFWLGKSLEEKEKIGNYFKSKIYSTRSKIVHTGKAILNQKDNEALKDLKQMTEQLIINAIETYDTK